MEVAVKYFFLDNHSITYVYKLLNYRQQIIYAFDATVFFCERFYRKLGNDNILLLLVLAFSTSRILVIYVDHSARWRHGCIKKISVYESIKIQRLLAISGLEGKGNSLYFLNNHFMKIT